MAEVSEEFLKQIAEMRMTYFNNSNGADSDTCPVCSNSVVYEGGNFSLELVHEPDCAYKEAQRIYYALS